MNAQEKKSQAKTRRNATLRWGQESLGQEEQHRLRRAVLFETAARAFNETGYYNTTLEELAKRLNVTKPALYYYVKDKDDILFECNRMALQHMQAALEEAENGTESGMQKLGDFLTRYTELMTNDFGACLIRTGLQPLRPESRAKLRVLANRLDKALRGIVAQGVEDGSIRVCDPKMVSYAIFGGFNGIATWFQPGGEMQPADVTAHFLDLFVHGLQPSKRRPR
ncbi:TetR/AcrR family transcriptional regulator [Paraburkholderia sp. MM5384-R2]|uniref:TetR/AcrR family transcriptional regulator n=1 Tax=Paraburkholderia sp. MM5384-R2 TaxID=2723097 RepID=UPI001622C27F|nr:TetR/AcrR family transcriptional regulator [Paraburkholderia sp. MM5384-R2]MBB5503393.1 AcrR family transcriptional regulator [Paraburkholderia sp. MM5384-R2]